MKEKNKTGGALSGKKIAFIGAGFMGGAIIRGLIGGGAEPGTISAYDPAAKALESLEPLGITLAKTGEAAAKGADMVLLAVKPQAMEKVIGKLKPAIGKRTLALSIAAGLSTAALERWLPKGTRVVRAMPNMAAAVGEAATAICAGKTAQASDMALASAVFGAVGKTVEVEEALMDAVTGLSGSGPAYVFLFLEGLIDAGVRCGLARGVADQLARQTLFGAAMMAREGGEHPAILKERITSPGGTTIAALSALENDGFKGSIIRAVMAAVARSRELGGK
jgi:pyrroline-5-carboxylate reductase